MTSISLFRQLSSLVIAFSSCSICACSDGNGDSDGNGGGGGGNASMGGGVGLGGGNSLGGGDSGGSGALSYVEKCDLFCAAFESECGVPCPQSCEGHSKQFTGDPCTVPNDALFQCLLDESPYNCTSESWGKVHVRCELRADDATTCFLRDGVVCERDADRDDVCVGSAVGTLAHVCAGPTPRPECERGEYTTFCCPD